MTLPRALALAAVYAVVVFGLGFALLARLGVEPGAAPPPSPLVVGLLVAEGVVLGAGLVWWGSLKGPGRTWRELGWHRDGLGARVAWGLAGGAAAVALVGAVHLALGDTVEGFLEALRVPPEQRLMLAAIGLSAAFFEESLFRGNLQPLLVARWGRPAGLLATALVFALAHLSPRPLALLVKGLLGLLFGALRARDGSLWSSAIAHALVWVVAGTA
jgi:membrane protease YdiL (CAAX protease family)